ncbi:MAG: hypothetical protein ABSG18_13055 [Steroidobacteraceae bacterium]|jgi:hypothetical protein
MRWHGVWPLVLVLAGCVSGGQANTPEAECRRQAYDDPTVKNLAIQNLGRSAPNPDTDFAYNKAFRDANQACLRQKGVLVRGGVESVRTQ